MFQRMIAGLAVAATLMAQKPAAISPVATSGKNSALNKPQLEAYLRHLFVWPEQISMTIEDPKPGPMPGYYEVKIRAVSGPRMQDELFYVSFDGKKVIRGVVYDVNQNPFKAELDKIKTSGQPAFGTPGAPVVIAEFSDYECPYCREQAKNIRENLLKAYPKEVRVYFFDYPLEQIHPWAKPAAIAGRCIFKQSVSAYWDYHDWAFDKQSEIKADNLREKVLEFAKTKPQDIDAAQLTSCMDNKETESEVLKTIEIGQSLNVNQTPTTFINGRRLGGATPWADMKFIIDYEIGYQKTAKNAGEDCGCDVSLPTFDGSKPASPGVGTLRK